jgi:hypothetical protein
MDTIWGYAAIELKRGCLKRSDLREAWIKENDRLTELGRERLRTVQKLSGSPIHRNNLQLSTFEPVELNCRELSLRSVQLIWSRRINPVLVLGFSLEEEHVERTRQYRRLKASVIQSILTDLQLSGIESTTDSVYSVIGTIGPKDFPWPEGLESGWLHLHSTKDGFLDTHVLRSLISDVAIEKSLLNRISHLPWKGFGAIFSAPRAASLIRRLPTEGLPDWEQVAKNRAAIRVSMNFVGFRNEILSQAKHWWTVAGSVTAILGILVTLVVALF